jgi:hypothetical protein
MADGVCAFPGETVTYEGRPMTYVGMLSNLPGMLVLQAPSGERVNAHHLNCYTVSDEDR